MDFKILVLGTDINTYTMVRCAHELYNKKIDVIGKTPMTFTNLSKICNIVYEPNLQDNEEFKKILKQYAIKNKNNKIILIGTNDHYIRLITKNKKFLEKYFIFNYPEYEIVEDFLDKDKFYKKYSKYFDMPKTFIYSCSNKKLKLDDFTYPIILKPSNGDKYFDLNFEGQNKVYKVNTIEELKYEINKIEKAGYDDTLIIQEFIPGDDSMLFDSMFYVDSNSRATNATFGQIGLQEHTKTGVGNLTVILNGYSEIGNYDELVEKSKKFLEDIKYTGFAEFDFKYDIRDNKYKLLEINPRQARSSYYFAKSSKNLVECLIDDLIYNKSYKFKLSKKRVVMSFVPKSVVYSNIKNEKLLKEIKKTIKKDGYCNALKYKKDNILKRKKWLLLRDINYIKKYKNKNWW